MYLSLEERGFIYSIEMKIGLYLQYLNQNSERKKFVPIERLSSTV
tara:strand:- start:851 stop:985 length:135 start_codon:yes stop_codon:yes gene_type:complete